MFFCFEGVKILDKKREDKKHGRLRKHKKMSPIVESMLDTWETSGEEAVFDVLGSYTGNPEDGGRPIQDADDL